MNVRTDTTEFIYAQVTADHDLTGTPIEVAVPGSGMPPKVWYSATVTSVKRISNNPARWTATFKLLVGPNGGVTTLTEGTYDWTFRVLDTPERPVRIAGTVMATLT